MPRPVGGSILTGVRREYKPAEGEVAEWPIAPVC